MFHNRYYRTRKWLSVRPTPAVLVSFVFIGLAFAGCLQRADPPVQQDPPTTLGTTTGAPTTAAPPPEPTRLEEPPWESEYDEPLYWAEGETSGRDGFVSQQPAPAQGENAPPEPGWGDPQCGGPPAESTWANAWGRARGVHARDILAEVVNETVVEISSVQSGDGRDTADDAFAEETVKDPSGAFDVLARFSVASAEASSEVADDPLESRQTTRVELQNVSLLDGLVTVDVLRAVASTNATPTSAGYRSSDSLVQGLMVEGRPIDASEPWFSVDLSERFGPGSRVSLLETMGHVHRPLKSVDGFAGDMRIFMIHVWLRDVHTDAGGDQGFEVLVSEARSHADFPQHPDCARRHGVQGHAFNLHATSASTGVPVTLGFVKLPILGGDEHQQAARFDVAQGWVTGLASRTLGVIEDNRSWAESWAEAHYLCLLPRSSGCAVEAEMVRVDVGARAFPNETTSTSSQVVITQLRVGGNEVCPEAGVCHPRPNERIDLVGVATIYLNEEVAMESDGPCHGVKRVRAIHVVPVDDLPAIIVGEAMAGAFYC